MQNNNFKKPLHIDCAMYGCAEVEVGIVDDTNGSSVHDKFVLYDNNSINSEGKERASAAGCFANDAYASARNLNANNSLGNGNDNFAGAFAVNMKQFKNYGKNFLSQATSLNITDNFAATCVQGCCDYGSIPYCMDNAENNTAAFERNIFDYLKEANSKRKLKNLKRFFINREIICKAVERCFSHASKTKELKECVNKKDEIIDRIQNELENETYCCEPPIKRVIHCENKKDRNATIYSIYDRCVQNLVLVIISTKIQNCISKNCYSGIPGRSIFSNNKTYCLSNKIRTYVKRHPSAWVGVTDIEKFYDNLHPDIVFGMISKVIVCPYTLRLLANILYTSNSLPIGGTLSQMLAMFVLTEMDEHICAKFRPGFYASFGDNRIIIDNDEQKVKNIVHYEIGYLEGRYNLRMKNDWQILPVKHGFRFCKYDYKDGFVKIRSDLKRRAIRSFMRGQKHYAGYNGILKKTDSKRLKYLIENNIKNLRMKNSKGMNVRKMIGTPLKINQFVGQTIFITDWERINNNKESEYFIKFQFVKVNENGTKSLHVCNNGSQEIKSYFDLVSKNEAQIGIPMKVGQEGLTFYFEGYHTTQQEALDLLCQKFNI